MTNEVTDRVGILRSLVDLLPEIESSEFGRMLPPDRKKGALILQGFDFNELGCRFLDLAHGLAPTLPRDEWARWVDGGGARRFLSDEALLATATEFDVAGILVTISRGERFCDGYVEDMRARGTIGRVLRRAAEVFRGNSISPRTRHGCASATVLPARDNRA